jgi:hypothetical protein
MPAERQIRHILKLRLLALVLALALAWYTLNPAPAPFRRRRQGSDGEPGGKRREERARVGGRIPAGAGLGRTAGHRSPDISRASEDVEELDWPEYICLD